MKNKKMSKEQQEILELAKTLYGEERINAYKLAERSDLEKDYANELLIGKNMNYDRGPYAFSPYNEDDWQVLRQKREFDKKAVFYDNDAVRKGLTNTHIEVYTDRPSLEEIVRINSILENHEVSKENRTNFFIRMRERAKEGCWEDEISEFIFGLKETSYSNLAAYTGVSRKEVVSHYLDNLFTKKDVKSLDYIEDLSTKLWTFMQKENVDGGDIVSRAVNTIKNYTPKYESINYETRVRDKASPPYFLVNELSKILTVKFPIDFTLKILKNYVKAGGELWENHFCDVSPAILSFSDVANNLNVRALREESLKNEIKNGPVCLVERINYAIEKLSLNPQEGWLRKSLENTLKKWCKTNGQFELSTAIYIGKQYNLLPREEIEKLEVKLSLIEKTKGKKE